MDVRDSTKIKTLPDDLRAIAEGMLEDKFQLPKKGEVLETRKKARASEVEKDPRQPWKIFQPDEETVWDGLFGINSPQWKLSVDGVEPTESPEQLTSPWKKGTIPGSHSTLLTLEELRKAQDMLRNQRDHGYGVAPSEWVHIMLQSNDNSNPWYNFEYKGYYLMLEGVHTGKRCTHLIDKYRLQEIHAPVDYVKTILDKVSHEMLEPAIIVDLRF